MATTENSDGESTVTVRVSIRVPCGTDEGLLTTAAERLARVDAVAAVSVEELHDIDPGLSATHITITARVEPAAALRGTDLEPQVTDAPGIALIERIEPAENT